MDRYHTALGMNTFNSTDLYAWSKVYDTYAHTYTWVTIKWVDKSVTE